MAVWEILENKHLLLIISGVTVVLCGTMKLVSKELANFVGKEKEFNSIYTATIMLIDWQVGKSVLAGSDLVSKA